MQSHNLQAHLERAVLEYVPPEAARHIIGLSRTVVVCGVTGAGKSFLLKEARASGGFELVRSFVTRKPRVENGQLEVNGDTYFFVDEEEFYGLVQAKALLECRKVHNEAYYGVSLGDMQEHGLKAKSMVMEMNIESALELKSFFQSLRWFLFCLQVLRFGGKGLNCAAA